MRADTGEQLTLAAAKPELGLLRLPVVDTLRISPLAFPTKPYHRLVKHYQDAALRSGQRNNPEHDSELAPAREVAIEAIVCRLDGTACTDLDCAWCRERHDAANELKRWSGFREFRAELCMEDGRSTRSGDPPDRNRKVGQLPDTGAVALRQGRTLTVVISSLVAIMADQGTGLEAAGIGTCVSANSKLSIPERSNALDRVRLGDGGILLMAPEQLRSRSVLKVLDQRRIGGWVLDEAHCLSRWGHDFRPNDRHVALYIGKRAGDGAIPPVMCPTATAKPDVVEDIARNFREKVGIELDVINSGAERDNLRFEVIPTAAGGKFPISTPC